MPLKHGRSMRAVLARLAAALFFFESASFLFLGFMAGHFIIIFGNVIIIEQRKSILIIIATSRGWRRFQCFFCWFLFFSLVR